MAIYYFCKDKFKMLSQKEQIELIILRFIDAHVDLYGEFNVPFIADTFRIHRTTASAIVTKYKKKKPSVSSQSCSLQQCGAFQTLKNY